MLIYINTTFTDLFLAEFMFTGIATKNWCIELSFNSFSLTRKQCQAASCKD